MNVGRLWKDANESGPQMPSIAGGVLIVVGGGESPLQGEGGQFVETSDAKVAEY